MASGKQTKPRGAKASRSVVSARAKPGAKAKKPAKPAKRSTKPAKPVAKATKAARRTKLVVNAAAAPLVVRELGSINVPSGKLAIFDIGLVGYLPPDALEPAIVTADVPSDRTLPVIGVPVTKGRFTSCWDHVAVVVGAGPIAGSKKLGGAGVDFARLALIDHAALVHWQHEDSLDGRADFVFSGRDAALLASVMRAPRLDEGYGWTNLTVAEAEAKADEAARRKASNKWLLAIEHRPHSHHFHALAASRKHPHGAGMLELAGTTMLLFFTTWGNGVFPIYLDLDPANRPVQIRIQLATVESAVAPAR